MTRRDHKFRALHGAVPHGMTLIECVLATALVALVLPVVLLALGRSHRDLAAGRMEDWAPGVIPLHLDELRASGGLEAGRKRIWIRDLHGQLLGEADAEDWRRGVAHHAGSPAGFLVVLECGPADDDAPSGCHPVRVGIEYPAAAPARHRRRMSVHTQMFSCMQP